MRRSYKFLLRPTAKQVDALTAMLQDHRQLYNAALQERRDAWRLARVSIRYGDQSAQLGEIRRADPEGQGRWSFNSQQATLRRLNRAFDMTRSARGTVERPGRHVAAKSGLNRSILDAGWGCFLAILSSKAESADRTLIAVDARNTSRRCPDCGHTAAENRTTQAVFRCVACGHTAHADVVGAVNVLRAGLARRAAQAA